MERRNRSPVRIELLLLLAVMALAVYVMLGKTKELEQKQQEAIAKEQQLQLEIQEENDRTAQLEEQKTYVKTDEYMEEVARDKLGLINPDEILFKEKEGD